MQATKPLNQGLIADDFFNICYTPKNRGMLLTAITAFWPNINPAKGRFVDNKEVSPSKHLICLVFHTFHKVFHQNLWKHWRVKKRNGAPPTRRPPFPFLNFYIKQCLP
jgi:hypothetical protein